MPGENLIQLAGVLGVPIAFLVVIILIAIWEGVWKLIALWKSARNNHLVWFIFLAIINTAGILPIIYIFGFSKTKKTKTPSKAKKKRR